MTVRGRTSTVVVTLLLVLAAMALVSPALGSCLPPPAGLVGWWPGDGNANDIIGTNNGTLQGGATANAVGVVGQAFSFNGTNAYVQIPNNAALQPTNLTVEAWVLFSSLDSAGSGGSPPGQQYIVFKQNTRSSYFEGLYLGKSRNATGDSFVFEVSSSSGQTVGVASSPIIATGVWYHVAGVRGSNFIQLYTDGQLAGQTNVSFAQNYGNFPLYFGSSGESYWDHKFKGLLDEVSLYNRALSSNEIASIYAAGAAGKCKAVNGISITTQPQSQSVAAGSNALFTVAATGTAPLGYQWQFNGIAVAGATNTNLALDNVQTANGGSYTVVVTNSAGSATSAVAVLTVIVPPTITTQPLSQNATQGTSVTFTVATSGTAPFSYQWQFNSSNISGATASSYTLANVQLTSAGSYSVVVSNLAGSATSSNATLTVTIPPTPPSITGQPQNQTIIQGGSATFAVAANGTPPLYYQWSLYGTNLSGATGSSYTCANAQPASAGSYSVMVSNTLSTATSSNALLTVIVPPTITTQPLSQTATQGMSVTFTVAASGSTPFSYQWQLNSSNISGATASSYTLANVQPTNAGGYSVVVSNLAGSATSSNATLTVTIPPAPPSITGQPQNQTISQGGSATFTVAANGTPTLYYQWSLYGTNLSGATGSSYTCANAQPANAGPYSVVVSNTLSAVTSSNALLTVIVPATITTQPLSQTATQGTSVTFTVAASGSTPFSYQWQLNSSNISSATASSYTLANVQLTNAGSYSVVVSNLAGSVTSSNATLTVAVPPAITAQPASQSVAVGSTATFSLTAAGTPPLAYQWSVGSNPISGATTNSYSVVNCQPTNSGSNYSCIVTNLYGSVTSSAALLTVTTKPPVIAFVQAAATNTGTASSYGTLTTPFAAPNSAGNCIVVGVTTPSSSTLAVSDTKGNKYTKAYSLALSWGSWSFQLWYATNIAAGANSLVGTFSPSGSYEQMAFAEYQGVALAAPLDVAIGKGGTGATAPATLTTGTTNTSANGDLVVAIANNEKGTLTAGAGFTNRSGAETGIYFEDFTQTSAGATAGTVVDNASSDPYVLIMTAFKPAVSASGVAPAIVTQPASATVLVGTSASFGVTASGSVPLNYQWYLVRHQRQRCDRERLGDTSDGPGQLELNGVCHGRQRLRRRYQQQRLLVCDGWVEHHVPTTEPDRSGWQQRDLYGGGCGGGAAELPMAVQRREPVRRDQHQPHSGWCSTGQRGKLHRGGDQLSGFGHQCGGGVDGAAGRGDRHDQRRADLPGH